MIAATPLSPAEESPRQCKLLGATVQGLGLVTAVSSTLPFCFAMIEAVDGVRRMVPLRDLRKDDVTFSGQPQPYERHTERVAYGTYEEVFGLVESYPVEMRVAA